VAVWLVAEDRVQLVRADRVVTVEAVAAKGTSEGGTDPVDPVRNADRVRIMAGTRSGPGADEVSFSRLLTCPGLVAVKALKELAVTLAQASSRLRGGPAALFVHGPLPRFPQADPMRAQIWYISEDLPGKNWPRTGGIWRDTDRW
jgi:hypothetical protein